MDNRGIEELKSELERERKLLELSLSGHYEGVNTERLINQRKKRIAELDNRLREIKC